MEKDCLQRLLEERCVEAEAFFDCGVSLYQKGLLERAITAWDKAIELDPANAIALYDRGLARSNLGRQEAAIADYDKAIEFDLAFAAAFYNRGLAKSALGRKEAAIADYDKAIELDSAFAAAFYNRGNAKSALGRKEAAIADYDKAIEFDLAFAAAFYNRGLAKSILGRKEAAIADYHRAIELDPTDAPAFYNRGLTKSDLGRKEAAIADYDKAIELDPTDAAAFFSRGNAKSDLGRKEAAIADYDKAIELDPTYATAFNNRGNAKSALGRKEAAISDYDKAIELAPTFANAFFNRGLEKWDIGLSPEAQQDFYRAIFLYKNDDPQKAVADLLRHFHNDFQSPFQVQNLLLAHPETATHLSFQTLLAENARQCRPLNTWLKWLGAAQNLPADQADWLRALVRYFMGDPIGAFTLLDELDEGDFAQQYFLLRSADDILHDERTSIRDFAMRAATAFAKSRDEDDRQCYWAGRLLHYVGEYRQALVCLKKGVGDMFNTLARADAYAEGGWGNRPSLYLVQEIIDASGIYPEENIARQRLSPDSEDWLWRLEMAAQFYDMEAFISQEFGEGKEYPRFWEIWDATDIEKALRELLLALSLARLQQRFGADIERIKSDPKNAIVLTIQKKGGEHQEAINDMMLFFALGEKISPDELFFMRLYQVYCQSPAGALQAGAEEAHKTFLENLLKPTLELIRLADPVASAIAGGIAQSLTALAFDFYAGIAAPPASGDAMEHYERFKTGFRVFIFNRIEAEGEEAFYRRYLLRGFDRF